MSGTSISEITDMFTSAMLETYAEYSNLMLAGP
jgi:hypothetical protein